MDNPGRSALFTDLYELTMAQAYDAEGMRERAVFELFFRRMPATRNYLVAAGLDDVLTYLEVVHFSEDDLAYLRGLGPFGDPFLETLRRLRFTGDVYAVPEGTVVFANEPLVRVEAPVLEAQLVETLVLNQVHFQTVAASKAPRVVAAAAGRAVVDIGSRRAHGSDAALKVARASYLVGAAGSSLVLAGRRYGIPVHGTTAHSYVQAHGDEGAAFEAFARLYPETTLLVDTYDTLEGVRKVIDLSRKLGPRFRVSAVRLDPGDVGVLAKAARRMLDEAGLGRVKIFASSEMDEYRVAELLAGSAPIDGFGVGTRMAVAEGAAHLDMVYKLVAYGGTGRAKLSSEKVIYPGRKQVFRRVEGGVMAGDVVGRFDERLAGEPLLRPVMRGGRRLEAARPTLEDSRRHASRELGRLPVPLRRLDAAEEPYPVKFSNRLRAELEEVRATVFAGAAWPVAPAAPGE